VEGHPLGSSARLLTRSALIIFLVTIVIGILNGLDVWDPGREMLLTHVHAGTLGWITVSVVAVALLMFGADADEDTARGARNLAVGVVVAVGLYVIAFATTQGIFRPIGGTLMLAAIVWVFIWVLRRRASAPRTIPHLAIVLALTSLVIGAVLGVVLGLFIANGEVPGLSAELAGGTGAAHPAAMLTGYLVLAGIGIAEWRLTDEHGSSKLGLAIVWALFAAGLAFNAAFLFGIDALVQAASALQVLAIIGFVVRMRSHITPSAWRGAGTGVYARLATVYLVAGVGLLVYVVQLFVSGQISPETGEGPVGVLTGFDHVMFIGVMTSALFSVLTMDRAWDASLRWMTVALNVGLVGFVLGLVLDVQVMKQIFSPIMGLALLWAIAMFLRPPVSTPSA